MIDSYNFLCNVKTDLGTSRGAAEDLPSIALFIRLLDNYNAANCALGLLLDGEFLVELVGWVAEESVREILFCFKFLV